MNDPTPDTALTARLTPELAAPLATPALAAPIAKLRANIERVMSGQTHAINRVLAAYLAGGHVLLEDNPGTGKTTLAKALAKSVGVQLHRVQFTPDLLPSDILGVSVFNQRDQDFKFHPGPIFTQVLLADEINRASPRTQSALLEAMGEGQVSIEGATHALDDLFFVIATQNPMEFRGTYPLPEAQMDRFAVRLSLGYVSAEAEVAIINAQAQAHPLEHLQACISPQEIIVLKQQVKDVRLSDELKRYAVDLVRATRGAPSVQLGAGPRASLALTRMSQALALVQGDDFVTPDHIRDMAVSVLAHRLSLDPSATFSGLTTQNVVAALLKSVAVPA